MHLFMGMDASWIVKANYEISKLFKYTYYIHVTMHPQQILNKTDLFNLCTLRYIPQTLTKTNKNWFIENDSQINPKPLVEVLLKQSIINKIINTNPKRIAFCCGGGIDSTVLISMISELFPHLPITAICMGSSEDEDLKHCKMICEHVGIDFQPVIVDNFLRDFPFQISIINQPRWNTYQYFAIREAPKYSNLLFFGDGGDELFGGYTFRYEKFLRDFKPHHSVQEKIVNYLNCHNRDWVDDQAEIFDSHLGFSWDAIYNVIKPCFSNELKPLSQVMYADFVGKFLNDNLITNTRLCDYYGLIYQAPFLSDSVVKCALQLPLRYKYNPATNEGKLLLRGILKDNDLLHHCVPGKKGLGFDLQKSWKTFAKDITQSNLSKPRIVQDKIVNQDWINRAFLKADTDIRYVSKLLSILGLEVWYRLFVTKDLKPSDQIF